MAQRRATRRGVVRRRQVVVAAAVAGVAALTTVVVLALHGSGPTPPTQCQATVEGMTVTLSPEQMGNAATIAGIAVRRGLPARAATIGIATAMQESKLVNVSYGDRDSLGLFQQRPSQGWGTTAQVQDPVYAANAFYDVLVKIEGYRSLPITKAAQKVQRSAYPEAYAQHEAEARVLASALSGNSPATLTCTLPGGSGGSHTLTALTTALGREQVTARRTSVAGSAGLRLRAASAPQAWSLAQWAVARSEALGVARVYVDGRLWQRDRHSTRWTTISGEGVPARGSRNVVLLVADRSPA